MGKCAWVAGGDVYCLFCTAGTEPRVVKQLSSFDCPAVSPTVLRTVRKNGVSVNQVRALLPGYVFFSGPEDAEPPWSAIMQMTSVLRILQYEDGCRALRSDDLAFVRWVVQYGGVLAISRVIQIGTRIRIVDGPLKAYEGAIVKVNKKRKTVAVEISSEGHVKTVWCSVEYLEPTEIGSI